MKALLFLLALVSVTGCAHTSRSVSVASAKVEATVDASDDALYYTAQRVLVGEGYPLARTDRASGTISTHSRRVELTEDRFDCRAPIRQGMETALSVEARVKDGTLALWTTMDVPRRQGLDAQNGPTDCVSNGRIERDLIDKITTAVDAGRSANRSALIIAPEG